MIISSLLLFTLPFGVVSIAALQSTGNTKLATLFAIFRELIGIIVLIGLTMYLSEFGSWLGIPIGNLIANFAFYIYVRHYIRNLDYYNEGTEPST